MKFTRQWAADHNVLNYYEYCGPCHQLMAEHGHVRPGSILVGTDSHTCTGGAFGAFATGIGSTEMAGVLISGQIWLRVPESIRVSWEGTLSHRVMAKDLSLKTIKAVGHSGATYKSIEYCGSTIDAMIMDERMCLSNMAVEMGAKVGLIAADRETFSFLEEHGVVCDSSMSMRGDEDAKYCADYRFQADTLLPQVACPHAVDHVRDVIDIGRIPIHQAYLGSCTGGRYHDLKAAAELLKGKKIAKNIRLLVSPASDEVWRKADRAGILSTLAEAGATILCPTCGVCVGLHSGMLSSGEVCISATNRNFIGRMGSTEAEIYLASPYTVAASALTGYICDPRLI